MNISDYEALTVAELKEMADQQGVEIPSDARKADIIEALAAAESKEETPVAAGPEGKSENVYNYQMSSTVEALCVHDDFWRLKLVS